MSATPTSPPADRGWLRLRAGVLVLSRVQGLVQVGLDPGRRVLLPDTPAIGGLLDRLRLGTVEPTDPELRRTVLALRTNNLLIDERERQRRIVARARTRTKVLGPLVWTSELTGILVGQGVTVVGADGPTQEASDGLSSASADESPAAEAQADKAQADEAEADEAQADLTVLISAGEPVREHIDALTHPGDPLLLVGAVDARVRLGPFVLPGTTACLRCVDAHHAMADPGHPLLPDPRRIARAEVSSLLMRHALLRAAVECIVWAEGGCPRSWSATTWIDEDLSEEHVVWPRHPHCGCSWEELLTLG